MLIAGIIAAVGGSAAAGTAVGVTALMLPPLVTLGTHFKRDAQNVEVNFAPGLAPIEGRSEKHPCGKAPFGNPQYNWDNCCNDLKGKKLKGKLHGKNKKTLTMNHVPLSCIPVASWYNTGNSKGTIPYACGDHCLEWKGISDDELKQIRAWASGA